MLKKIQYSTNSTEQSPSWENHSNEPEIHRLSGKLNFHYRAINGPPLDHLQNHMNPVHILKP